MCSRVRDKSFAVAKSAFKLSYIAVTSFLFVIVTLVAVSAVSQALTLKNKLKAETKKVNILKGKKIVLQSGCYTCHSFVKGKRYDGVASLAYWGDKHLTVKQTEKAIRSCKADVYCSQILTDKQVKYVAEYLNSLKNNSKKLIK